MIPPPWKTSWPKMPLCSQGLPGGGHETGCLRPRQQGRCPGTDRHRLLHVFLLAGRAAPSGRFLAHAPSNPQLGIGLPFSRVRGLSSRGCVATDSGAFVLKVSGPRRRHDAAFSGGKQSHWAVASGSDRATASAKVAVSIPGKPAGRRPQGADLFISGGRFRKTGCIGGVPQGARTQSHRLESRNQPDTGDE